MGEDRDAAAEELPSPSAELVLIRVFVSAYLRTAHEKPRRRAPALLEHAARLLDNEESVALLLPIRPTSQRAELARARRQALTMFRQLLPSLIASVPPPQDRI